MFTRPKKLTLEDNIRRELLEGMPRRRPLLWFKICSGDRLNTTAGEQEFYDLFSWLPIAIELQTGFGWSVDATQRVYVEGIDSPLFGRHFEVHYNTVRIGHIQASPTHFDKENYAHISMRLTRLHYLPYPAVHSLVQTVIWLAGSDIDKGGADSRATAALTAFLWETVRLCGNTNPDQELPLFEYSVFGPCIPFRENVEHWVKNRMPPKELVRWRYETDEVRSDRD